MTRVDANKALGTLLGLAVGDRLGEGTADTRMALRLASSLVELGGFDADHTLRSYVAWLATDPPGLSEHMREVLGQVASGVESQRATSGVHLAGTVTSGNGALARTTPIGIAFAGNHEALRDATLEDASLTHFDALAGKAALLHNEVISWLLTSGPQRVFDELKDASWLDDRVEDVVVPAISGVLSYAESLAGSQPGSALASLAIGLAAMFNAEDFESGLVWAVDLGGDPDTDGAVAGALLGARLGASAIPARWLDTLELRGEIEAIVPRLVALAG